MMLRASSQASETKVDLKPIVEGSKATSGVPGETVLLNLIEETVLNPGSEQLRQRREELNDELGSEALVDAAAVIGNFQRMTRIADGTGIPLDDMMAALTSGIRNDLGLNSFGSADRTREPNALKALMVRTLFPLIAKRMRRGRSQKAAES